MSDGSLRGLFIGEDSVGHRTVYENISTAAHGTSLQAHVVNLAPAHTLRRLRIPSGIASSLTVRQSVRRLVAQIHPDYLITNTHKPVLFCHDLLRQLPTAIAMDATPVQFDQLGYFVDATDSLLTARRLKYLLVRSLFHTAAVLLPWSNWAATSLARDYGVPPGRIVVTPPGIDTDAWSPIAKSHRARPKIVFVGGDFERKGGDDLLRWYRQSGRGKVELTIVTRDRIPEEEGVRLVRAKNNSRDLRDLVRGADIFVLPTKADCFSIAGQEAMASGVPVILGKVGGIPDLVEEGVTGFLVPPGDSSALDAALEILLSSESLRRDMGIAARDRALSMFDNKRQFARLIDLARALVAGSAP